MGEMNRFLGFWIKNGDAVHLLWIKRGRGSFIICFLKAAAGRGINGDADHFPVVD